MKITNISVYQANLPMKEGAYSWSTQSFAAFDSSVVIIDTDSGQSGAGETCPLGPAYLPAFAEGARAGLAKLAPGLLGENPIEVRAINDRMDELLKGHPYIKSALDMACWDLFGKATGQPVYTLLGGMRQDKVRLFKVVSRQRADDMARKILDYQAQGFKQFQVKVGAGADDDIERIFKVSEALAPGNVIGADANTGWRQHDAIRVVKAVRDVDVYIEQPCASYRECLAVRRHCNQPMILDECIDSIDILMQGYKDSAMDLINLKLNRVGGLTKACEYRDLCINMGLAMTVEDSWGGEIATAAIAHFAHSLPAAFHFQSSAFHEYTEVEIAGGAPRIEDGYMRASDRPGLGVEPNFEALGEPVFVTR